MNMQLFVSLLTSIIRLGLGAAAGALAIEVRAGDIDTTAGTIAFILCGIGSLAWSYFTHKKNIATDPKEAGATPTPPFLIVMFALGMLSLGAVCVMPGCGKFSTNEQGQPVVTAEQFTAWKAEADKAQAELQVQINEAKASGADEAAAKVQAKLDEFAAERAKWEAKVKVDEQGNVDLLQTAGSAAMVAFPSAAAGILFGMALLKRVLSGVPKPPAIPATKTPTQ